MKKYTMKVVSSVGILSSLFLLPITSLAVNTYSTETGHLSISEVQVDDKTFYDNVGLKLNFATGTFELVSGNKRPETGTSTGSNFGTISKTPLESSGNEDINLDFMGCERVGGNQVNCHVNFTSLGGFDRNVEIYADGFVSLDTKLYDSHGTVHIPTRATIANLKTDDLGSVDILLVSGVPTLAIYQFHNLSPERDLSLFKPLFKIHDEILSSSFHKFDF